MLTSPLKRPARRTLPAPSILPSMVMSAAIMDSRPSRAGRRIELGLNELSMEESGSLRKAGSGAAGAGVIGASFFGEVASFQIAIARGSSRDAKMRVAEEYWAMDAPA